MNVLRFILNRRFARVSLAFGALSSATSAFELSGNSWPSGTIPMQLQLDATKPANVSFPLIDGATSWNTIAISALEEWNNQLSRTRFTSTISNSTDAVFETTGTKINNVVFADTQYGDAFGAGVLAITLSNTSFRKTQADVIVNKAAFTWNSYRGARRSTPDLRRVLLHEFGHVLALNHPDQASPPQSVPAIMNSQIGNNDVLLLDDINGAKFLYSAYSTPVLVSPPTNQTVNATGTASLAVTVNGQTSVADSPIREYAWFYAPPGSSTFEKIFAPGNPAKLDRSFIQLSDAGRYRFTVTTPDETVTSDTVTLSVNPVPLSNVTQLANVSSRGVAGSGANSMIVGFFISGSKPKKVLVRAIGPTLSDYQVPDTLADPVLTLRTAPQGVVVARNNDWGQPEAPLTAGDIRTAMASVGAFSLREGSADAVIYATLAPGSYSAVVSSPTNASGVVLLEAYDAETPFNPDIRLTNLSTRGFVGTGANILIAGFVVNGTGPKTYLIRAVGPTLLDAPFNFSSALTDPYLRLFRRDGQIEQLVRETDDWDSPSTLRQSLRTAALSVGAFPLREERKNSGLDSVLLMTLSPGSYSAQMSGFEDNTGVGLIEVYELPNN